jgi:Predicted membrane protein (DUF2306)
MDDLLRLLLWLHVLTGTLALGVAPGAMLTVKGGRAHRRWGKAYFWLMAVVAATAIVLGLWRPATFLILLAVFSFYAAFTGYRVLHRKRPEEHATPADWIAALLTLGASLALVGLGLTPWTLARVPRPTVAIVLGTVGVVLAARDISRFLHPPHDPRHWWFHHMTGMLTSYVAAVTAFSVVNFGFLPTTVRWLWPTLVGTVGIALWARYYRLRFAARPLAATVA